MQQNHSHHLTLAVSPDPRARSLEELEARARYELQCLSYPAQEWLPDVRDGDGRPVLDVLIVGAGQGGISLAIALQQARVSNVAVLDKAEEGQEGPWITFARMLTLRTPKYLTGPDCGIPSLTFRAWYEAQDQAPEWEKLERIPRGMWMDYLVWLRQFMDVPIQNGSEVVDVASAPDGLLAVKVRTLEGITTVKARKVVFATGIDGGGAWAAPDAFTTSLPRSVWAHTADPIDFGALRGSRVAVLGLGASALDNAATALDHGAARVDIFFRRNEIPKFEVREWLENIGFLSSFSDLDDANKWSVMRRLLGSGAPPPPWSLQRVRDDPRVTLRPASAWQSVAWTGEEVEINARSGTFCADFVIFGTGSRIDFSRRSELVKIAPLVAKWGDRFVPPPGETCATVASFPYLGAGLELTELNPGTAPWISNIHMLNFSATASNGLIASSITGMKFGLARIVPAIVRDLYLAVSKSHIQRMPWDLPTA